MKVFFFAVFVMFLLTSQVEANTGGIQGGEYKSMEEMIDSLPQVDGYDSHIGIWVCYSRYIGSLGWGHYYGWAHNILAARNNAYYICASRHADYYNCLITGCHIQ